MEKYYVSGCKDNGSETVTCDDNEAQFWTLYVRDDSGLSQGIIDLAFREDAETAMAVYVERDALQEQVRALKERLQLVAELNDVASALHVEVESQVRALAAEGGAIKQAFKQAANTVEEYEIHGDLKYAVEPSEYEALADAIEETPATDDTLREIRAQAVDSFMSWSDSHIEEGDEYEKQLRQVSRACKVFASRIRAGEQP